MSPGPKWALSPRRVLYSFASGSVAVDGSAHVEFGAVGIGEVRFGAEADVLLVAQCLDGEHAGRAPRRTPAQPKATPGSSTRTEPAPLGAPRIGGDAPRVGAQGQPRPLTPAPTTLRPVRPGGQPDGPAAPPTVGGGEKERGDVFHNGQLHQWDDQQQRWHPIAGVDPGAALPPAGSGPTTGTSGHLRIGELDQIFHGQPDELERYQKLSRQPADQLSDADYKFVHSTREQITLSPNEPMTKVLSQGGVDNILSGRYAPDQVIGFVARARDTDQLRTPKQLRDGLALTPPLDANGKPAWPSALPDDNSYAYQLTWQARDDRGMSVPYGAPEGAAVPHLDNLIPGEPRRDGEPFTGTGTTAGEIPEWHDDRAPIMGPAQMWHIDQAGNRRLYADYDPTTRTWKLAP